METEHRQGSEGWHAQRVGKITSSRASAILGRSKYATPDDVMREMVRGHFKKDSEIIDNIAMKWGRDHERQAVYQYEEKSGNFVISTGFVDSPDVDFLGGSPDGLIDDDAVLEVKCPFWRHAIDITKEPTYADQVQHLLSTCARSKSDFVVWKPSGLTIQRVDLDRSWLKTSMPIFEAFIKEYRKIIADPELAKPYLAEKWQTADDAEWNRMQAEYIDARAMSMYAETEKNMIKMEMVGRAITENTGSNIKLSNCTMFKTKRKGSVSYKKIVDKHLPDLDLEEYRGKPSTSWSVRVTGE